MKYISFSTKLAVVFTSIIVSLSFFSCKHDKNSQPQNYTNSEVTQLTNGILPIAYVNVDSLLIDYVYAQDVNEKLTKKIEEGRLSINQKTKKLESESADFKKKYENNAFLSAESAQQAYNRLQKQEEDLAKAMEKMQNDLLIEQNKENMQIVDSIRNAIGIINASGKYQIIFNMREMDNILYANPALDITKEVLDFLNNRYKTAKK